MPAGHELDAFLGKAFEEKPVWTDALREHPGLLLPRQAAATGIDIDADPGAGPDGGEGEIPWPSGSRQRSISPFSLFAIWLGIKTVVNIVKPPVTATNIDVGNFDLKAPKAGKAAGGGGGGGSHDIVDPIKGKLPPRMKDPITPPMIPMLDKPKLAVPSAINVQQNIQLPDNPNLPNIGVIKSRECDAGFKRPGRRERYGNGLRRRPGFGTGNGFGPGRGGNTGGGLYQIGGGVSAPVPIFTPEAEFSDEARRAKYQGVCLISLIVDAQGNPQNPRVVRALGMGLDEKALEAVRKYKFKPAYKDGRTPVPVMITVEVNFRLY